MPENDAGTDLGFQRLHRCQLRFGKGTDIALAECGILNDLLLKS